LVILGVEAEVVVLVMNKSTRNIDFSDLLFPAAVHGP
jgi:hypothetical protein